MACDCKVGEASSGTSRQVSECLRKQHECRGVPWTDDREVAAIKGGHLYDAQALGHGNDRGVHGTQREVLIRLYEATHTLEVAIREMDQGEPGSKGPEKRCLSLAALPLLNKLAYFCHYGHGYEQRPWVCPEKASAALMVLIAKVRRRDQRTRVKTITKSDCPPLGGSPLSVPQNPLPLPACR